MVFDHIEELKREYTDKYVVVDATQPELQRFEGQTGVVRTVNMNGSALVEFDANLNIGWFDISPDFLKVIDAPLPKPEPKKAPAKKPAAKKADAKPAAKDGGAKMSVAEMMAAARGEKGGSGAAAKAKPAAKPAEPKKEAAKAAGGKMSVADMLAAARAEKEAGAAPAAAAPAPEAAPEPAPEPEPTPEPAAAPTGDLPKDPAGIVEYCRKADG